MKSLQSQVFAGRRVVKLSACLGVLMAWLAVGGCSSSNPQNPPVTPKVVSCTSDDECSSLSLKCDLTRRECVCVSDSMCSQPTPYCNVITGRCVEKLAGCTSTSCGEGQFCDAATRTCQTLREYCESCSYDAQCGEANRCVIHPGFASIGRPFCAHACGTGDTCPNGQECRDTTAGVKQCVPKGALCTGETSCTPDAFTVCENDAQCTQTSGQRCDTSINRCVASTTVCSPGQSCDPRTHSCVQACTTDDQCTARLGDGFVCLQRACRPASECTNDDQCPMDQFCLKNVSDPNAIGRCAPTCTEDANCPIGKRCIANARGRKECVSACSTNSDCLLNEICSNGTCEAGHCQVKAVCGFAENCISNVCVKEPNSCNVCPSGGNACSGGGSCLPVAFNETCGSPNCPGGSKTVCVNDPNCGGQFCYCTINRCLLPCATDPECPQGFSCTTLPGGSYCVPVGAGQYCLTPP